MTFLGIMVVILSNFSFGQQVLHALTIYDFLVIEEVILCYMYII